MEAAERSRQELETRLQVTCPARIPHQNRQRKGPYLINIAPIEKLILLLFIFHWPIWQKTAQKFTVSPF